MPLIFSWRGHSSSPRIVLITPARSHSSSERIVTHISSTPCPLPPLLLLVGDADLSVVRLSVVRISVVGLIVVRLSVLEPSFRRRCQPTRKRWKRHAPPADEDNITAGNFHNRARRDLDSIAAQFRFNVGTVIRCSRTLHTKVVVRRNAVTLRVVSTHA